MELARCWQRQMSWSKRCPASGRAGVGIGGGVRGIVPSGSGVGPASGLGRGDGLARGARWKARAAAKQAREPPWGVGSGIGVGVGVGVGVGSRPLGGNLQFCASAERTAATAQRPAGRP